MQELFIRIVKLRDLFTLRPSQDYFRSFRDHAFNDTAHNPVIFLRWFAKLIHVEVSPQQRVFLDWVGQIQATGGLINKDPLYWLLVRRTESRLDAKQLFLAMSSNATACFEHKVCIISLHKSHNHHSSSLKYNNQWKPVALHNENMTW